MKEYMVSLLVRVDENIVEKYGNGVEDMVRWSLPEDVEFEYDVLGSYEKGCKDEEDGFDWLA